MPATPAPATPAPAMSPSTLPIGPVLDRATGPRRSEADELLALHEAVSGHPPVVWAGRILGFGQVEYRHPTGRSGIMPLLAFAPGPKHHTLYLSDNFADRWPEELATLGPHRSSVACLYLTRLSTVDRDVLRTLLERTRDGALDGALEANTPDPHLPPRS